jgi:predicted phage tail protein
MITVILYGFLAEQFGKTHKLAIKTPAEAIRALSANYAGFKKAVVESGYEYRVLVGKEDRATEDGLHLPATKTIKIVPLVSGSGGFGKVLLGAALIVASFYLPGATYFSAASSFSINASAIASSIGFSLLIGGVSQILFAPPKPKGSGESEKADNRPSYSFNGAVNTTGQGNPVPVAYGKLRVGSQVISAGIRTANL